MEAPLRADDRGRVNAHHPAVRHRSWAFLQGPPGPLFYRLGREMRARGVPVHRINLNGGDLRDGAREDEV